MKLKNVLKKEWDIGHRYQGPNQPSLSVIMIKDTIDIIFECGTDEELANHVIKMHNTHLRKKKFNDAVSQVVDDLNNMTPEEFQSELDRIKYEIPMEDIDSHSQSKIKLFGSNISHAWKVFKSFYTTYIT